MHTTTAAATGTTLVVSTRELTTFAFTAYEVGPCGCPGCEKWADCHWCDHCSEKFGYPSIEEVRQDREDALGFAEWLYARGSDAA